MSRPEPAPEPLPAGTRQLRAALAVACVLATLAPVAGLAGFLMWLGTGRGASLAWGGLGASLVLGLILWTALIKARGL